MTENKQIRNSDFAPDAFDNTYSNCTFIACDFSQRILEGIAFEHCRFYECNFSMAKLCCRFVEVQFDRCKMLGADLSGMLRFSQGLIFTQTNLSYSSLVGINLRGCRFLNSIVMECDFAEANLSETLFEGCDLSRSQFWHTNLENANLKSSHHYTFNPEENRIKNTKVSECDLRGLVAHLKLIIE